MFVLANLVATGLLVIHFSAHRITVAEISWLCSSSVGLDGFGFVSVARRVLLCIYWISVHQRCRDANEHLLSKEAVSVGPCDAGVCNMRVKSKLKPRSNCPPNRVELLFRMRLRTLTPLSSDQPSRLLADAHESQSLPVA